MTIPVILLNNKFSVAAQQIYIATYMYYIGCKRHSLCTGENRVAKTDLIKNNVMWINVEKNKIE